ncbi:MAG: polyprenyl synthetase family protein [Kiritimatiellia bacterium]
MFDLNRYLKTCKAEVDEILFKCLPAADKGCPEKLAEAMAYAVKSGGKRLRPILCLAAAEAAGGRRDAARMPACAVELLHSYTLVHDDLPCMDNDMLRRGQLSVHAKYGEALAILTGDALLSLAFETLAETPADDAKTMAGLFFELSRASGASGVIGGQVADLAYAGNASADAVNYVFEHKTADLFRAAVCMGAMTASAPHAVISHLSAYAGHLGFAFQVIDDIIDAGQATSDDEPELSCLDIMSVEEAHENAAEHTRKALALLDGLPGNTEALAAIAEMMLKRAV